MATRVSSPLFIGRQPELKTLTDAVAQAGKLGVASRTEAAAIAARLDREG